MRPIARYINEALSLNAKHALYRSDGVWYHHLEDFPGVLFDSEGYLWFNTKGEYANHPGLNRTKDLNIPSGIASIEGYRFYSPDQLRLVSSIIGTDFDQETVRRIREVNAIQRNRKFVAALKKLYKNQCQICGLQLEISPGVYYSEIHHIKPLGKPHNGPDVKSNMICVCPNHHVLLDLGGIKVNNESLIILNHELSQEFLEYHNEVISH